MEHTDFYMMYKAIRDKEVVELKNALQKFPNHQYDWDENDEPRPRIVLLSFYFNIPRGLLLLVHFSQQNRKNI